MPPIFNPNLLSVDEAHLAIRALTRRFGLQWVLSVIAEEVDLEADDLGRRIEHLRAMQAKLTELAVLERRARENSLHPPERTKKEDEG